VLPHGQIVGFCGVFRTFGGCINNEHGIYDCSGLLEFGVFKELRDKHYFKRAKVTQGTVVWPHEQDICPDTLYLDSIKENT